MGLEVWCNVRGLDRETIFTSTPAARLTVMGEFHLAEEISLDRAGCNEVGVARKWVDLESYRSQGFVRRQMWVSILGHAQLELGKPGCVKTNLMAGQGGEFLLIFVSVEGRTDQDGRPGWPELWWLVSYISCAVA